MQVVGNSVIFEFILNSQPPTVAGVSERNREILILSLVSGIGQSVEISLLSKEKLRGFNLANR